MYLRLLGLVFVIALLVRLARSLKPTRFGLVFGLLLFYIPMHYKIPLNALPMVNVLTVALALLITLLPTDRGPLLRHASTFRTLALAFCGVSALGLAISASHAPGNLMEMIVEFKRWVDPAVFGILALAITRNEDRKFVLACMMTSYAIVAVHGVREGLDYGVSKRIPGLLGQSNETGAFLAMYAPLGLTLALLFLHGRLRLALIGITCLGGWALVPTLSRGSWIAYGMGMVVALVTAKRTGLAIGGIVLGLCLIAIPGLLPDRVSARFEETVVVEESQAGEALEDNLEPSAAARIMQWKASLAAMSTNPIGAGFGQFKKVIGGYGGISGLDAHNFFFLVGVEFGIAGSLLAIALFVKMAANAWAVASGAPDPFMRSFGSACCATIVAAVIVNCVGSRFMQDQPSTYLWVLAAMMVRARDALDSTVSLAKLQAFLSTPRRRTIP